MHKAHRFNLCGLPPANPSSPSLCRKLTSAAGSGGACIAQTLFIACMRGSTDFPSSREAEQCLTVMMAGMQVRDDGQHWG